MVGGSLRSPWKWEELLIEAAVLGETLRRSVQEIEDAEFERIETTPAQGKNVV